MSVMNNSCEKSAEALENSEKRTAEELIILVRQGDQVAFSELSKMYEGMLTVLVSSFSLKIPSDVYSREDLYQESLIAFYRAAKTYNMQNSVTFGLYAKTCVKNVLISLLRKSLSIKRKREAAMKKQELKSDKDVLTLLIEASDGRDEANGTVSGILGMLTAFELDVLTCYTKKMSYVEMAESLSVSTKSIDNALYRIRKKIKKAGFFKSE